MNDPRGLDPNALAGADYERRCAEGAAFEQAVADEVAATLAMFDADPAARMKWIDEHVADPAGVAYVLAGFACADVSDETRGHHARVYVHNLIRTIARRIVARRGWE